MKLYYWKSKNNFGDLLGPLLLKKIAGLDSEWSTAPESQLVTVGSILEHLPTSWSGVIAGCGKLHENSELNLCHTKVLAVRGPLTARGFKGNIVLGDPGLIADELVGYQDKEYNLGIVPHWSDNELELNPIFLKYNPKIIRVGDDPLEVIRQIGQCKKIVSSSLHGIILADAFGIPRRIEIPPRVYSHPHIEGGLFKWRDYSESIGMKLEIGLTQEADQNTITDKQHELFDVFKELKSIFGKTLS